MDKLIKKRNSNIGCKIVNQYDGVFCYADDMSLLCPSSTGLKDLMQRRKKIMNLAKTNK